MLKRLSFLCYPTALFSEKYEVISFFSVSQGVRLR